MSGIPDYADLARYPIRHVEFLARDIDVEHRPGGVRILRSRIPLKPYERHIPGLLKRWAVERPGHVWLAQRRGSSGDWHKITYAEAGDIVDRLTQALLDMKLPEGRPIAVLSGNSPEHALLTMAAMQARIPIAPISPAYSLGGTDHEKLRYIFNLISPSLVFVLDGPPFERAIKALNLNGIAIVHVERPVPGARNIAWTALVETSPGDDVLKSINAIQPKTVAKFLFTSGSTGTPKAVINTQEMMCANVAMIQMARVRGPTEPEMVMLDWLPWNHTMGGNATFNDVLAAGGSLYLDDGRPAPGLFEETLRNLREISPTYYSNVPVGYLALAAALESDDRLARSFFKNLALFMYAGAALPNDLFIRLERLAVRYTGHRITFFSGWGSTETAPGATSTYWEVERVGLIGLPHPGVELKLVPVGSKFEIRVRGVIVTPGYHNQPDLTAKAFDEEGFYRTGDAAHFVDADDPTQGLVFGGRLSEDFKLMSGTFVHAGPLREAIVEATAPLLQHALIAGQDKEYVGLLAWPNLEGCRRIAGAPDGAIQDLVNDPKVIEHLKACLRKHNAAAQGSSFRIKRAMLMTEPPSIDGNEVTDKGYINQRAALERRCDLVARLYADPPGPDVVVLD